MRALFLYVGAAVNEATGEFKVFTGPTITVEKILASAAIPSIFRAVHITDPDDEGIYWDGLFSQNPPVRECLNVQLDLVSKFDRSPPYIQHLIDLGEREARRFIEMLD